MRNGRPFVKAQCRFQPSIGGPLRKKNFNAAGQDSHSGRHIPAPPEQDGKFISIPGAQFPAALEKGRSIPTATRAFST